MLGFGGSPLELLRQSIDGVHTVLDDHKQIRLVQAELAPTLGTTESNYTSKLECDFGRIISIEHDVGGMMDRLAKCTRQRTAVLFGDADSGANCFVDLLLRLSEEQDGPTVGDTDRPILPDGGASARNAEAVQSIRALEGVAQVLEGLQQLHDRSSRSKSLVDKACKQVVHPPAGMFDPCTGKLKDHQLCTDSIDRWTALRSQEPLPHTEYQPFILPNESQSSSPWRTPIKVRYGTRYHIVADYCSQAEVDAVIDHWRRAGAKGKLSEANQLYLRRLDACVKYGPGSAQLLGHFGQEQVAVKKPRPMRHASRSDWWYVDQSGKVQGRFTRSQMQQWLSEGYFNMRTLVHCSAWSKTGLCGATPTVSSMIPVGEMCGGVLTSAFVTSLPGRVLPELLHAMTSPVSSPRLVRPESVHSVLPGMSEYDLPDLSNKPPPLPVKSPKRSLKRKRAEQPNGSEPVVLAEQLDQLLGSTRVFCGGLLEQSSDRVWVQQKLRELVSEAEDGSVWQPLFLKQLVLYAPARVLECGGQLVVGPAIHMSDCIKGKLVEAAAEAQLLIVLNTTEPSASLTQLLFDCRAAQPSGSESACVTCCDTKEPVRASAEPVIESAEKSLLRHALVELGLDCYTELFAVEEIDPSDIGNLTDDDLAAIGIPEDKIKDTMDKLSYASTAAAAANNEPAIFQADLWRRLTQLVSAHASSLSPYAGGSRLMAQLAHVLYSHSLSSVDLLARLLEVPLERMPDPTPSPEQSQRSRPKSSRSGSRGPSPSRRAPSPSRSAAAEHNRCPPSSGRGGSRSGREAADGAAAAVVYPQELVQRCRAETLRSRINLVTEEMSNTLGDISGGAVDVFKRSASRLNWPAALEQTVTKVTVHGSPHLYHSQVASSVVPLCSALLLKVCSAMGKLQQAVVEQAVMVLSANCDRVMVTQARTQRRTVCTTPQPSSTTNDTTLARKQLAAYMEHAARPIIENRVAQVNLFNDCAVECHLALRRACRSGASRIKEQALFEFGELADKVSSAGGVQQHLITCCWQACSQAKQWLLGKDAVLEQLYQVFMRSIVAAAADRLPQSLSGKLRFSSTASSLGQVSRVISASVAPVYRCLAEQQHGMLEMQLLRASMSKLGLWRRPQMQPSSVKSSGGLLELCAKLELAAALPMSPPVGSMVQLPKPTWQLGSSSASVFGTVLGTLFVNLTDDLDLAVCQLKQILKQWLMVADLKHLLWKCCGCDASELGAAPEIKQRMVFLAAAADICGCAIDVYTAGAECTAYRLEPSVIHPGASGRSFRVACDASGLYSVVSRCAVMSPAQPRIARFTLTQEEKDLKRRTDEEIATEEDNIAEAQAEVEKRKLQRITQVNRID